MGLGHEGPDPTFPGQISRHLFGESAQRMFYRRWAEFMTSPKWPMPDEATKRFASGGH